MAFTGNGLENIRLVQQAVQLIVNYATNMRNNAQTHIAMANAQDPDLATLAGYVNDCAAEYQRLLGLLQTAITTDPVKTKMLDGLARQNCASTDITTPGTAMINAANALAAADKSSYAAIITACNALISAVPQPASVWPE
jgi:hypothetical protein